MYKPVLFKLPVDCEPLVNLVPDQEPEAMHEVAFVELQDRVEDSPVVTDVGLAEKSSVGGGGGGGGGGADTFTPAES